MTGSEMDMGDRNGVELVSAENVASHMKGLPFKAKLILRAITRIRLGALNLVMPDGRQLRIEGRARATG